MKVLFDSCILIDYLQGVEKAKHLIQSHTERYISVISWMEVLTGAKNSSEEKICKEFLDRFILVDLDMEIAERSVALRKHKKLKLPDAVIWASAQKKGCILLTRDTTAFPSQMVDVKIPYRL